MYKLKETAQRLAAFGAAFGLLAGIGAQLMPVLVSADALNPLTSRTLLLSSSSPGWSGTDGSGNSTYAPPGSGANGTKTGETFSFHTSTDSSHGAPAIKALTFQYCTGAAGLCTAPGDDASDPGGSDSIANSLSDFNVNLASPSENGSATAPAATATGDNFVVVEGGTLTGGTVTGGTISTGWTMSTSNLENGSSTLTGKNNFITLTNTTGITPTANEAIQVVFFATNSNYITNPGEGSFFVKINDYSSSDLQNWQDNYPNNADCTADVPDFGVGTDDCPSTVVDGGVTVANVMNQSIEIQTKVLETMDFSVGVADPDMYTPTQDEAVNPNITVHGTCNPILTQFPSGAAGADANNGANALELGNADQEYSLSTTTAYDQYSYWRLSSNSANGGTVYYSGSTLHNTEGNAIAPMSDNANTDAAVASNPGTEQFGLGLVQTDGTTADPVAAETDPSLIKEHDGDTYDSAGITGQAGTAWTALITANAGQTPLYWHNPTLYPLAASPSYGDAYDSTGTSGALTDSSVKFAFNADANTIPVPIATENQQVVNCATGKMRYVANIAATTPAGIYTTKINYLAAPEY